MIHAQNLTKSYRDLLAIDDVSFRVSRGEVVGFLGTNGAGKTTTMRILAGSLPPSSGTALIGGVDVMQAPKAARAKIGYLPEVPPLYVELTVREYLRFVATLKGLHGRARNNEVTRVLQRCGLGEVENRLVAAVSKGYRQRTGIAQALLGKPEVLLLDEPTAGLDPRQVGEVRELMTELAGDHTVFLSTHSLREVVAVCQRVVIINRGKLVADDPLQENEQSLEKRFLELTEL